MALAGSVVAQPAPAADEAATINRTSTKGTAMAAAGEGLMGPAGAGSGGISGVFFPETFTLANGMEVVVVTNRRVPVVTHMVWYRAGAADEPYGRSGIAHFLEHLMFKGTAKVAAGEFSKIITRHGGRDNAFTSWDFTAFFQTVSRGTLELVMGMEADRMTGLHLTDALVLPERDVVLEERRQRVENEARFRLNEEIGATLFVHHPYRIPIIGWEHEIATLTREDAERYYRTWYAPNNAILVISGDIDADQARPLVEKYYGVIPARPVPARVRPAEPPISAARRLVLRDPDVHQPTIQRNWQAPSYRFGAREHAYALQVLEEIIDGGQSSRFYRSLVVEQRVASAVAYSYLPASLDYGSVAVWASPAPGGTIEALEAALDRELGRLVSEGVTAEEVVTARERLLADAAFSRDSLSGPAYELGMALATGQSVADVEQWPTRISAVDQAAVNAAARAVLGQPLSVTGLLLPAAAGKEDMDDKAALDDKDGDTPERSVGSAGSGPVGDSGNKGKRP